MQEQIDDLPEFPATLNCKRDLQEIAKVDLTMISSDSDENVDALKGVINLVCSLGNTLHLFVRF